MTEDNPIENRMKILVRMSDGTETDITEAVKIMYDVVHSSLDWGSGFLDADEAGHIIALADVCGFQPLEDVKAEVRGTPTPADLDRAKTVRAMFRSIPKKR
jgi:hypothetical protein